MGDSRGHPHHAGNASPKGAALRLRPVRRESTVGLIADQLRAAIRNGSLPPGTPLVEGEVAAQLGVSRGPLREATQRLVAEGLLVSSWHRRLTVPVLSPAEIHDLYATREPVERRAWTAVLRRADHRVVSRLADAHLRVTAALGSGSAEDAVEAHLAFHEQVAAEAGSPRLRRLMRTLLLETRLAWSSAPAGPQVDTTGPDLHGAMLDALRRGDAACLLRLNSRHMGLAAARLAGTPGGAPISPDDVLGCEQKAHHDDVSFTRLLGPDC